MTERVDAIRAPVAHAGAGDSRSRIERLQNEYAPLLNVARVYVRNQGLEHFISGNPGDTLDHPSLGALAGQPRYTWRKGDDGVLLGQLNDIESSN